MTEIHHSSLKRAQVLAVLLPFSRSVASDSATPWTAARPTSLPISVSRSLPKLMSVESVAPCNHLALCHALLLLPRLFPSIVAFSSVSPTLFKSTFTHFGQCRVLTAGHGLSLAVLCLAARLCVTICAPADCSPQAPPSMGFSRQDHWTGVPCRPPGDLPDSGTEFMSLRSPALTGGFLTTTVTGEVPGRPPPHSYSRAEGPAQPFSRRSASTWGSVL